MPERITYLDHAATTPMRPEAVEAMLPFLTERFGNPSGAHPMARDARRAVDEARDVVADCLGCAPGEVVFTGSGTEADNTAIVHDMDPPDIFPYKLPQMRKVFDAFAAMLQRRAEKIREKAA